MAAHELTGRFGGANTAAVSADEKVKADFKAKHAAAVQRGAESGAAAGVQVGAGAGQVILAAAKRMGAHQCDNCSKQHLYNYMTCDHPSCSQIDNRYDLCYECYAQFKSGAKFHPATHTMSEHHNATYTIKLLGAIVLLLMVLRFLMSRLL